MADTYYSRLTLINPEDANKLDPRLGVVIAETATTGRFVMGEINWTNSISPNFQTSIAYNGVGDLKIFEPMGFTMFDYIRAAAFKCGVQNHLTALYLLEIEILAENFINGDGSSIDTPMKYIWPIMLVLTDVKSSVAEKGSEYIIKFIHASHYSQTDLVQPLKENITIKTGNVQDFFDKLSIELETKEFKYAEARQKASSTGGKAGAVPGGAHPAASDDFHDEYHFLVQPTVGKFTFTSKGKADPAVKESFGSGWFTKQQWDISARPGTTIISWINKVLMSTKEIADLMPGKKEGQKPGATGSSSANEQVILDNMGRPYQFFRIETYTVMKSFDYVRGRYAMKYVFLIFLSDQPNMYQYPDELDIINRQSAKQKVTDKLKYYIQEGLLRKVYYHNYTGLNSDIIKVDLQFNNSFSLPSFPVLWTDRHQTGPGQMNPQNYRKDVTPFVQNDKNGTARYELNELRKSAAFANAEAKRLKKAAEGTINVDGLIIHTDREAKVKYEALTNGIATLNAEILKRENELRASDKKNTPVFNAINNRTELLDAIKENYVEDFNFKDIRDAMANIAYSVLRPPMNPDIIGEGIDDPKAENEKLMEKIFSVLLGPRDMINLDLEIIADPYWLGVPHVFLVGKENLSKIDFSSNNDQEIKELIEEKLGGADGLDPDWNTRINTWGNYGNAPVYKGSNLIYFNSQSPTVDWDSTDTMMFNTTDQILGIYQVWQVTNTFKDGKWTQKLSATRDMTIPSHILPKGVIGEQTFEAFMQSAIDDEERVADKVNELRNRAEAERAGSKAIENLTGIVGMGASGIVRNTNESSTPVKNAMEIYRNKLKDNPPPVVNDPVTVAETLMAEHPQQYTKDLAYAKAKEQYIAETKAHFEYTNQVSKEAYQEAGISNYKPYPASTLSSKVLTESGSGGLEDWKRNNTERPGPADVNNPGGLGFDVKTNTYNRYSTFNEGVNATTEYYNFGQGVPAFGNQGQDRLLLPSDWKGTPAEYITKKSRRGNI